jgi:hypothetical protein
MTSSTTHNDSRATKVDLFPTFKQNIVRQYPEADGWKVFNRFNWVSYLHDFVLQRDTPNGSERVLIEVNTDKQIKEDQIRQLREVAARLEHDGTKVTRKVLVINQEADCCTIPQDIEICLLNDFLDSGLAKMAQAAVDKKKGGGNARMVA